MKKTDYTKQIDSLITENFRLNVDRDRLEKEIAYIKDHLFGLIDEELYAEVFGGEDEEE